MKISEAFKLYHDDKKLLGYSIHTLRAYKIQCNLLIRYLGDVDIEEISFQQLKSYLIFQEHLKPSSLSHRIRYLKSFFHWSIDEGYINKNPSSKLKEPKIPKRFPKNLHEKDLELLRIGCKSPREHAIVELFYATGCRIGELASLDIDMINWSNETIIVFGKGSKERIVNFSTRSKIWLEMYLDSRKDSNPALFVTLRKYPIEPRRLSISQIRDTIKIIAKHAGIKSNIYPHMLRHTFAMGMLESGAPIEVIKEFLGHSKVETTEIYAQMSSTYKRELYKKYHH